MGAPSFSIIVPAYNAAKTIAACVEAVANQTLPRDDYEIIVVDDGSTDETARVAAQGGARVISISRAGPAVARNRGVAASAGTIVLFTDADCAPAPNWIENMVAPFARGVDGVKGAYLTRQKSLIARFVQAEFEERYRRLASFDRIDFVDTYAAAYRRELLADSGGFDPRFALPSAEDIDLSFRLASTGCRFVFEPSARVYHRHPETLRNYLTRKWRYGVFRAIVYCRFPGKVTGDSYTPRTMLAEIGLAGLITSTVAGSVIDARLTRFAPPLVLAHLAATLPFATRAARTDPLVGVAAPALLLLRSFAQLAGIGSGFARVLVSPLARFVK